MLLSVCLCCWVFIFFERRFQFTVKNGIKLKTSTTSASWVLILHVSVVILGFLPYLTELQLIIHLNKTIKPLHMNISNNIFNTCSLISKYKYVLLYLCMIKIYKQIKFYKEKKLNDISLLFTFVSLSLWLNKGGWVFICFCIYSIMISYSVTSRNCIDKHQCLHVI